MVSLWIPIWEIEIEIEMKIYLYFLLRGVGIFSF